jgi:hypothetical protein
VQSPGTARALVTWWLPTLLCPSCGVVHLDATSGLKNHDSIQAILLRSLIAGHHDRHRRAAARRVAFVGEPGSERGARARSLRRGLRLRELRRTVIGHATIPERGATNRKTESTRRNERAADVSHSPPLFSATPAKGVTTSEKQSRTDFPRVSIDL